MDNITYDVRIWKTEIYKGAKVTTYRVRWKTGPRAVETAIPDQSASRELRGRATLRSPQR